HSSLLILPPPTRPPLPTLFPYTTLFRSPPQVPGPSTNVAQAYSHFARDYREGTHLCPTFEDGVGRHHMLDAIETAAATGRRQTRSEEHTSELQSLRHLVCRLLLEKKKQN